jgi:hypothetical protein
LDLLESEVNFTGYFSAGHVFGKFDFRAESCGRDAHDRGKNLASLDVIVVNSLLTHDSEVKVVQHHNVFENLGSSKRLKFLVDGHVSEDVNSRVSAHGKGSSDTV